MKRIYKSSVTVGIPTYEASDSLIQTIQSICQQTNKSAIAQIMVIVDGNALESIRRSQLENLGVRVIEKRERGGQSARINDLCRMCDTPFLILTNDDVIWSPRAIEFFIARHEQRQADLMGARAIALPARTFIEHIISIGARISDRIAQLWNRGDNYLSFNGRLLFLTVSFAKTVNIPSQIWNNDAYLYFHAKQQGFITKAARSAICWYQAPMTIRDYINQSVKFRASMKENIRTLGRDVAVFYRIPHRYTKQATMEIFQKAPLITPIYIMTQILVRIISAYRSIPHTPYWHTDKSTKSLQKYFLWGILIPYI